MKNGIELIAQERSEHFTKHGRNIEKDVMLNTKDELIIAARALINPAYDKTDEQGKMWTRFKSGPHTWSDDYWLKVVQKPLKQRLIIAGALIAAEIDRLQYLEQHPSGEQRMEYE